TGSSHTSAHSTRSGYPLSAVEPTVGVSLGVTELCRDGRRARRGYLALLGVFGGDPDCLLHHLDASPHQPLGLLLPARTCRLSDKLLRGSETLHQGRRQVLARAEGLREGHLDGASARTRPHTSRSRRIEHRSLIDARTAATLVVRHAHRHAPRAAPTSVIVGREGDVVDPPVASSFALGAHARSRG